ncbi:HD-GYP domain-containing protein [Aeromonas simiae]|uniref:HD-GYP domain-containing protein n=1 Tax=Aeromonas simiae TaxID=218936 RepID=UPI00266B7FDD|nr:HD-GYP domain-containing protein [Aeromonas simiae]MDO2946889.1 HD-GYP domain-containing protein [Aeromonas simiae]MDO2951310.1 HD-GYP domain-containing protein [Aeromonas simiae]MDO2954517.1 HD-GYP domain-containing protein [Aeromonas simiae]
MALVQASIEQLRVGHYVHLPGGWHNHPFLFNAFKIKDEEQLNIIRHLDTALLVMVDVDKSDLPLAALIETEREPTHSPQHDDNPFTSPLPLFDEKAFRRSMRVAEKAFSQSVSDLRNALGALNLKPDEGLANTAQIVRSTAAQIANHEGPLGLHLIRIHQGDPLLHHSLNVAYLAMLMGRELGMAPMDIEAVGLAGLIHDIGELRIPTQITQKRGELSKAEINFLRMHPQYGFDMLNQLDAFEPKIRLVALQHHERLDGSGYPKGLKGDEISPLARIIGLTDHYDELLHPRASGLPAPPNLVVAQLYKLSAGRFDPHHVKLLIKLLGIYPPGSLVQLSDESLALVLSTEPSNTLKPKILPFIKGQKPEGVSMVDLKEDERSILRALSPDDLDDAQRQFFNLTRRFSYYFAF